MGKTIDGGIITMMRRLKIRGSLLGLVIAFALVAAACAASTPAETTTEAPTATVAPTTSTTAAPVTTEPTGTTTTLAPPAAFKVCQVSDTGGIDDKGFNETAWLGAQRAAAEIEGVTEAKFLESQSPADFRPNIDSFIDEGCDLIVTVGFLLADDTQAAAQDNPDAKFAIIDFPGLEPNIRGLTFATEEAAYLAGYLAAGVTKTGIVGTYGGINIPPVTVFMDGFFYGVQAYNDAKGTTVKVLGWDPANPDSGLFTGNFESTDDGLTFGQNLIDEGADILFPVAGPVGLGSAQAALDNPGVMMIGVDADQFVSTPAEFQPIWLTSVLKRMDNAVFATVKNVVTLGSLGNPYTGTLANDGVGLAPYHDLSGAVSDELAAEVEALRQGIINGTVTVIPAMDG